MKRRVVRITLIVFGTVLFLIVCVAAYVFWALTSQLSPAEAEAKCADFEREVRQDINAIPGYSTVGISKYCSPQQDEIGGTDYILSISARVATDGLESEAAFKNKINGLSDKLPQRNYPVWVDNLPATADKPATLCVTASRYIDNDGKDYPQGPPEHYPRYTAPGSLPDFAPCKDV